MLFPLFSWSDTYIFVYIYIERERDREEEGLSMVGEVQLEAVDAGNPSDSDPLLQNKADSSSQSPGSSSEINNEEDIENSSVPCCRICLESDCELGDELF